MIWWYGWYWWYNMLFLKFQFLRRRLEFNTVLKKLWTSRRYFFLEIISTMDMYSKYFKKQFLGILLNGCFCIFSVSWVSLNMFLTWTYFIFILEILRNIKNKSSHWEVENVKGNYKVEQNPWIIFWRRSFIGKF